MAIAKIKKVGLIGLQKDKDRILALLQNLALVQLVNVQEESVAKGPQVIIDSVNLLEAEEVLSYLATFKEQASLLSGMVTLKPHVPQQQLQDIISTFDYQGLLKQVSELRTHLKNLEQHRERLIQERHLLTAWRNLKIPLDQLHQTNNCGVVLGVLRTQNYANLFKDCTKANINLFWEIIRQDKTNTHLAMLYVQEEFEHLDQLLKNYHFNFVTLSRHKCTVVERLLEINREVLVFDDQLQEAKNKIAELAGQSFKLMVIYDYFYNIRKRQEADQNLAKQQFTFSLSGWLREKDIKRLEQEITQSTKDIAVFISEPKPEEEPPVILENKRLVQPFEFITSIYGMPKYNELDPTPFLAPFFFLYFGFCISDAGYGFILALFSLFVLKNLKWDLKG